MNELKKLRIEKKITQKEAAARIGVSLRTYITYENEPEKSGTLKYRFLVHELEQIHSVDENHGILTIQEISDTCREVLKEYPADFCILFGSYAKGTAGENSDVDLVISSEVTGLQYYELTERLRTALRKKVDLLNVDQLLNNRELLTEILKEGVRIYGKQEDRSVLVRKNQIEPGVHHQ